jgi:hypothetical protein
MPDATFGGFQPFKEVCSLHRFGPLFYEASLTDILWLVVTG